MGKNMTKFIAILLTFIVKITANMNYFSILPTQSAQTALKPQSSDHVQYVSANGNDRNDGLSLGTAKQTVYAALLALPSGKESTLTAGYGTVWLVGNVTYGGPVKAGGFWIMGHSDPNYSSPPRGWLKSSGPISLRAYSPSNAAAQNHMPSSYITAGAGAPDLSKPAMWISGLAANYWIKDVGWGNYVASNYIRLGICSPTKQFPNGDRSGTCGVQQVTIDNSAGNFGDGTIGTGPGIDIGSNTFWIWIRNSAFGGGSQDLRTIVSNAGLSRKADMVTVTTTARHAFVVGQNVTIFNASDPTFNASLTISSVRTKTTFTFKQIGPDATSGGGQVWSDRSYAIAINPYNASGSNPGGASGSGLIFVKDMHFGLGGVRLTGGVNGGGVEVDGASLECPFSSGAAGVEVTNGNIASARVNHVEMSDCNNGVPGLMTWNGFGLNAVTSSYVDTLGANANFGSSSSNARVSPRRQGITGFNKNEVIGDTNIARRGFPPQTVRYENLAKTTSQLTVDGGSGTLTRGYLAPDGTNGAAQLVCNTGQCSTNFYLAAPVPVTLNDWYVCGYWTRSTISTGTPTSGAMGMNGLGYGNGDYWYPLYGSNGAANGYFGKPSYSDGNWHWYYIARKVWSNPTQAGLGCSGYVYAGVPQQFYAPIFMHIPTTDGLSDNEVYELAASLSSYSQTCKQGQICDMVGPVSHDWTSTVAKLPSASANPGAMIRVTDSTAISTEGQTCVGGSSNMALAFSNGHVWKCF